MFVNFLRDALIESQSRKDKHMKQLCVHIPLLSMLACSAFAGTWTYDFSTGLDTNYWSFINAYGTFNYATNVTGVEVYGGNGSFQTAKLSLNMNQFPEIGDFTISVTFSNASFSGGVHQVQLEVNTASSGTLLDRSYQISDGILGAHTVNVFDGSAWGFTNVPNPASGVTIPGTLGISRAGSTYSFYWNEDYLYSKSYTSDPLSSVFLALNNNFGATDSTRVIWQSFSITSPAIPEPSTVGYMVLGLTLVIARRGYSLFKKGKPLSKR